MIRSLVCLQKERTDGWQGVQILEIAYKYKSIQCQNVLLWLLEGCQYQDHISASDISPLSKTILVFQVCVNRRTWYMLQYNNTYVKTLKVHNKKGNLDQCKYWLLFTSTTLLLHNVPHYYPWLHPNLFFFWGGLALIRCAMKEGVKLQTTVK